MNTIVSVAIFPVGEDEKLAEYVSEPVKVIKESGLDYQFSAMNTQIEGPYDEVMQVVKEATMTLADKGFRTYVSMNVDIRPGSEKRLAGKVDAVNKIIDEEDNNLD